MRFYSSFLLSALHLTHIFITPSASTPINTINKHTLSKRGFDYTISCKELTVLNLPLPAQAAKNIREANSQRENLFPDNEVLSEDLQLLGEGQNGCVFGLKHEGRILAVAKIYKYILEENKQIQHVSYFKQPIQALSKLRALYGISDIILPDGERLPCIFMRYEKAVSLNDTKGYKDFVGATRSIKQWDPADDPYEQTLKFYSRVADDCGEAAFQYAVNKRLIHGDLGFNNMLFTPNYPYDNALPIFIDWDEWHSSNGNEDAKKAHDQALSTAQQDLGIYWAFKGHMQRGKNI
ncbi:hypothetical protein FRC03_012584 [Tulasnella sp. 419]|nr:hypothetical protein FRC03_012584 [Tulasnella sp. 419]